MSMYMAVLFIKSENKDEYANMLYCSMESILTSLQAFTLNADYSVLLSNLEGIKNINDFAVLYTHILFICAPIAGGCILLEIISKLYPRLRYTLNLLLLHKEMLYFSVLNENSITFARQAIENKRWFVRPIPVFAYSENNVDNELLSIAKAIGAICINDNILNIRIRIWGKKRVFLIDSEYENNLKKLAEMTERKYCHSLKRTKIYVFSEHDFSVLLEEKIEKQFRKEVDKIYSKKIERQKQKSLLDVEKDIQNEVDKASKAIEKEKNDDYIKKLNSNIQKLEFLKNEKNRQYILDNAKILDPCGREVKKSFWAQVNYFVNTHFMPDIKIVNGNVNIIRNLFCEKPLFEPLAAINIKPPAMEKGYELNVTIVGAGGLGTEAFLSAYWMGQLLNCKLTINVISKEDESEFKNKIDFINPEILKTSKNNAEESLLKIYNSENSEIAEPYFDFKYIQTNVRDNKEKGIGISENTDKDNNEVDETLKKSHYIIVVLGSDEENIIFAERIKKLLKTVGFSKDKEKYVSKSLIAYAVYDSEVCEALNREKLDGNIYMHAFGSLKEIYCPKNIYMEIDKADEIHNSYIGRVKDTISTSNNNPKKEKKTAYEFWSDIARAYHIEYKVFSAGKISKSVFDERISEEGLKQSRNSDLISYKALLKQKNIKKQEIYDSLAWLEHRRWNSYMRANGFIAPEDFKKYMEETESHKNIPLKLHPCIVECSKKGKAKDLFKESSVNDLDMLDIISLEIMKSGIYNYEETDYKKYDYPEYDFNFNNNGEII